MASKIDANTTNVSNRDIWFRARADIAPLRTYQAHLPDCIGWRCGKHFPERLHDPAAP